MRKKANRLHRLPSVDVIVATALLLDEKYTICPFCEGSRKVPGMKCYRCVGLGLSFIGSKTRETVGIASEITTSYPVKSYKKRARDLDRAKKAASREL